ncbi:hypothetical protein PoB_005948400 [Plakobranchus ocellatus]|uniref:Uncharacterized protein n=1 Tax=Plakobranchus ocellatus TaxID=259542 RepID=A0AAV4CN33_9GAST|nr:hypothetical protein PoB_005948400 [Plakobranchus ocellatus]
MSCWHFLPASAGFEHLLPHSHLNKNEGANQNTIGIGYIASGDVYTRRFDEVAGDIDNKTKVIKDTIMSSPSTEDTFLQASKCDSILQNSPLSKKLSISQALKSLIQPFAHTH